MRDPFAHLGDDRFPMVSGQGGGAGPLIDLPHRGNALDVRCLSCGREARLSGRRLATEFRSRLAASVGQFVRSLRCGECQGKRLVAYVASDPMAEGFRRSTLDPAQMIWARRLDAWLQEAGSSLGEFRDVLRDLPSEADRVVTGTRAKPSNDGPVA
ncbi:hypothetical protein [Brevundimonas bacteroides]|uniref:hypothetical protein n=1 Tax=Brevundimonas bacteroides TaxID=74311 RepID=UPI00049784B4|nr:hypothetical protein [Brevundimonas bacteroides]